MRFFRKRVQYELSEANVPADWSTGDEWMRWPAPRNLVAGESLHVDVLRGLTGEPLQHG
jgi:hypothetical protein